MLQNVAQSDRKEKGMTHIKKTLSFLLIISILISAIFVQFSFNVSAATRKGTVVADVLNIREKPNTSSNRLGRIEGGATVQINSEQVGQTITDGVSSSLWFNITYNGITGWVSSIYINEIPQYDFNQSFENQIAGFPESYKPYLRELHAQYPNWRFYPDNVNNSFDGAVSQQLVEMRKQVQIGYHPISWRSMGKGAYEWDENKWIDQNGGWTGASREIIRYYMDPRNFLNSSEIYMFLMQNYGDVTYTAADVKSIVVGTFLDNDEYINIILKAGEKSKISPYAIASKIIQEQGVNGKSDLISGNYTGAGGIYKGFYNFFNWSASGDGKTSVIERGLKFAMDKGWNTKEASIVGGAEHLYKKYVSIGQNTYYYQDFNVHGGGSHQYAQAVHDARNKGAFLQKLFGNKKDFTLIFRIPIFLYMPESPCVKPVQNDTCNNYYFNSISVSGLTPSFYRYTYNYDLHVTGDTIIDVSIPSTASINCALEFPLKAGDNKVVLKVRSQSGYDNDYTINVNADQNCTLYINKGNANVSGGTSQVKGKGDINGDGKISVSDMSTIRLHLLGKYSIGGSAFNLADVNNDGKITVSDMSTVRLHLLGKYTIQ